MFCDSTYKRKNTDIFASFKYQVKQLVSRFQKAEKLTGC